MSIPAGVPGGAAPRGREMEKARLTWPIGGSGRGKEGGARGYR